MAKKVRTGVTEDIYYRGSFVYKGSSLSYILHEEGLVDCKNGKTYQYNLKDHLGNVRTVFKADANNKALIEQEQHYYPFGMVMNGLALENSSTNKYKYNGKEYQEETGWLDYGARMYDPSLARWSAIDLMAEEYTGYSPYNYVLNNPIKLIDPDGQKPVTYINEYGTVVGGKINGDKSVYMVSGLTKQNFDINNASLYVNTP